MNHLIAYPLTWDDIELRANNTIGIYKIKNKIAVLSCVSYTAHVDDSKDYMHGFILTNFSTDFMNHGQIRLMDLDDISALDCELNEKDGRFIINTKKYKGKTEVRGYQCMTLDFYWRLDDDLYIGPYWYGIGSQQTITYRFKKGRKGFDIYEEYFENLWSNEELTKVLTKKIERRRNRGRESV